MVNYRVIQQSGPIGEVGDLGPKGISGPTGTDSETPLVSSGPQGPSGFRGFPGPPGNPPPVVGPPGYIGSPGTSGPLGTFGAFNEKFYENNVLSIAVLTSNKLFVIKNALEILPNPMLGQPSITATLYYGDAFYFCVPQGLFDANTDIYRLSKDSIDSIAQWTSSRILDMRVNKLAYDFDRFIAVGSGGFIMSTSIDGITWTNIGAPPNSVVSATIYDINTDTHLIVGKSTIVTVDVPLIYEYFQDFDPSNFRFINAIEYGLLNPCLTSFTDVTTVPNDIYFGILGNDIWKTNSNFSNIVPLGTNLKNTRQIVTGFVANGSNTNNAEVISKQNLFGTWLPIFDVGLKNMVVVWVGESWILAGQKKDDEFRVEVYSFYGSVPTKIFEVNDLLSRNGSLFLVTDNVWAYTPRYIMDALGVLKTKINF